MKVAIAVFGTRISPRFDCAPSFEVLEIADAEILSSTAVDAVNMTVAERIKNLAGLGIETFICGGIDVWSARELEFNGMKTYSWITGEAKDALTCLLNGQLESCSMMGAGGRCCGQWRFGGRGSGRGRGHRGVRRGGGRQGPSRKGDTDKGGDQYA